MIKAVLIGAVVGVLIGCAAWPSHSTPMRDPGCLDADSFDAYCVVSRIPTAQGTTLFRCLTKDGKEHRFFDGGEA
jgi:hypothetical protein